MEEDCRKAIRLDHNCVKVRILVHLFLAVLCTFFLFFVFSFFNCVLLIPTKFGCLVLVMV